MLKFLVVFSLQIILATTAWSQQKSLMEAKQLKITDRFTLRYTMIIPADYHTINDTVPLILALHYGFDPSKPFPEYYGRGVLAGLVYPALKPLNAIMIAPDSHGMQWHEGKIKNAVLKLVDKVKKTYRIDPQKRIVTGFSMGGKGTWHFAANYSDQFDLAIPVAGIPGIDDIQKIKSIPIYAINSNTDHLFPSRKIKPYIEILKEKGIDIKFPEVGNIPHFNTSGFILPLKESIPWILSYFEGAEPCSC